MKRLSNQARRPGAVLPLVTVCLIGLLGFVALAIDIGLMVVARTQCQNAADIAALAGARTLDGSSNNNVPAAIAMAYTAAESNQVLNAPITAAQVTSVQAGIYRYNSSTQTFEGVFGQSPGANEAYGAIQATIVTQQVTIFARVLGMQSLNVGAVATAVHRPVDIALVLDFSGSMGYASFLAYPLGAAVTGSLNPDPLFPQFGPWSVFGGSGMVLDPNNPPASPANLNTYVPPTPMQRLFDYVQSDGQTISTCNLTYPTSSGSAIVNNFLLSDNATSAFVSSASSFPSFTNVNVSGSSNPTYVVTPAPASFVNQNVTGFVGDPFPLANGVTVATGTAPSPSQYAHNVADILGFPSNGTGLPGSYSVPTGSASWNSYYNAAWETNGYDGIYTGAGTSFASTGTKPAAQKFQGFTMGPGYYGKTFYMWPPDPRTPVGNIGSANYVAGDWRQRFFSVAGTGAPVRDNSVLWGNIGAANGVWNTQNVGTSPNYIVNYNAILAWLAAGPQTLPPTLRSGRVVYYGSIPTTIPVDPTTGENLAGATADQCFWRDYIDYVLGAGRYNAAYCLNGANKINGNTNNATKLYYNNPSTTPLFPSITAAANLTSANGNPAPYMNYTDSPIHPRTQFWFGPLSMLGYLQSRIYYYGPASTGVGYNYLPGTCYEAPMWQLKVGVSAVLSDIQANHPNDMASLIYFSSSSGYSTSRVSMGKSYTTMQNALFYPYPLLGSLSDATATIRPFTLTAPTSFNPGGLVDNTDTIIPASGTETCPQMAFMVAYNELGSASSSSAGVAFSGRVGAAKLVIFETDGMPNATCSASLTATGGGGAGSYYYAGIGNVSLESSVSTSISDPAKANALTVVQQITALTTANPPGYSTARNPAQVHAIAFGELFEPTTTSAQQPAALRFLTAVQIYGNTSPNPGGSWLNDSLDYNAYYASIQPYKIITGNATTRIANLTTCMQTIMQSGIQIALIQ